MDTETMIRNLKKVEDDHKGDKVFTGQLNIADMAHDVRLRLEELKPYEDTSLTQEQIRELKDRDWFKRPAGVQMMIRAQAEQIREDPAEYLARKYNIRGDADGQKDS